VRRLRNLVQVLRDDNDENDAVVEVDSPEWPGLNATANILSSSTYLHHSDKDVRLYTVLACIEMLTIVRLYIYLHLLKFCIFFLSFSRFDFSTFNSWNFSSLRMYHGRKMKSSAYLLN
jgi:hypothetical protein